MKKIGILGGGQLGLMSSQAAMDFNFELGFLDPDPEAPCSKLAGFVCGDLMNESHVVEFGRNFDVVSIEIEKVNVSALEKLEKMGVAVFPPSSSIAIAQNKIKQKQFFLENGFPTAPFVVTQSRSDLLHYQNRLPAVHKLAKDGYDGRGVKMIDSADQGFDAPSVLEQKVTIEKELSVIVARNQSGEVRSFPVVEQVFNPKGNLLDCLLAPAQISVQLAEKAIQIAQTLTVKLNVVGLLAVEFFYTQTAELWVNEVAPRPHNSGHHTIESNYVSQFSQLLRALAGLPLGNPEMKVPFAAVVNLLGEEGHIGQALYKGLDQILALDGIYPHLYGKQQTKPLRKMGHITVVAGSLDELKFKIENVKSKVRVVAQ